MVETRLRIPWKLEENLLFFEGNHGVFHIYASLPQGNQQPNGSSMPAAPFPAAVPSLGYVISGSFHEAVMETFQLHCWLG